MKVGGSRPSRVQRPAFIMIDLHSHILPGFDDGAGNLEDAVSMARRAAGDGIRTMVATPHLLELGARDWQRDVEAGREALQERLDREGIELRVVPGAEVFITPDLAGWVSRGRVPVLGSGLSEIRYMLIEFPLQQVPPFADQVVFELMVAGIVPVIAHPERCLDIIKNPDRFYEFRARGVLGQLNAGSLSGAFGPRVRETAEVLLTHNMVQVIASDGHGTRSRPCNLSLAVEVARRLAGEELAERMVSDVPRAILAGEEVSWPEPARYRPPKKGLRLFPWIR